MRAIERVDPSLKFVGDQVWQPLVRVEAGVASGDLDAACAFLYNKARGAKFVYIDLPLFPVNYRLVIREAGLQHKVKLLPAVIHTENFHMVMAKTTPAEVVEKMRKALVHLDRSGELARLLEKWDGE